VCIYLQEGYHLLVIRPKGWISIIQGGTSLKHLIQSQRDRILSDLESCGGNASRSMHARRTKLRQEELDSILEELELDGIIKRTRLRTGSNGPPRELIALKEEFKF
jgi:DNA-binding HxlR family transcriptional regulator